MKLHKLTIKGFRRHKESNIYFSNASFLIGENNTGKSSILKAIELLLNDEKKVPEDCFFQFAHDQGIDRCNEITLTAEFRELPNEATTWRGFKGRIFSYSSTDSEGQEITGNSIFYRKTFKAGTVRKIEMKSKKKTKKEGLKDINTIADFIKHGFNEDLLADTLFEKQPKEKSFNNKSLQDFMDTFEDEFDFYDYSDEEIWDQNPGGIAGNVISKLPKVIYIPAHDGADNLGETKGAFQNILLELFTDVRNESQNYKKAQILLDQLAKELDPENSETEFGKMMGDLNNTLSGVFSGVGLNASAKLSDADSAIKPSFSVSMTSNIPTTVEMQGTGVIRSTVFALLRFKALRDINKTSYERPLIICFEEPEIYLHPNAANQMRDTIYELANTANNQIVCSTHSPYMIDLGKRTGQVLNYLYTEGTKVEREVGDLVSCDIVSNRPFNIKDSFRDLQSNEKDYVKLILKMDDYLSRIFFANKVLIVEGDTEEIVFRETISLLPEELKKNVMYNWQIIRARGKASIIALVKYLKAMGIKNLYVMHDLDLETDGALVMNEPIRIALGDDTKLIRLENCIEDILGYPAPSKDKPYVAYKFIRSTWKGDYNNVSSDWKGIVEGLFSN